MTKAISLYTNPRKGFLRPFCMSVMDQILRLYHLEMPSHINLRDKCKFFVSGCDRPIRVVAQRILKPGEIAIDIGAHVGLVTKPFARIVGRHGRVYAFEPDPSLFTLLKRNVRALPQVHVSSSAVSDASRTSVFHLHPESGMSNSLVNVWEGGSAINVVCCSLDDWLLRTAIASVRLVKIDVEGAEPLVLRGMKRTMASLDKPNIIAEFSPSNLGSAEAEEEVFFLLTVNGYEIHTIDALGNLERVRFPTDVKSKLNERGYVNIFAKPLKG